MKRFFREESGIPNNRIWGSIELGHEGCRLNVCLQAESKQRGFMSLEHHEKRFEAHKLGSRQKRGYFGLKSGDKQNTTDG